MSIEVTIEPRRTNSFPATLHAIGQGIKQTVVYFGRLTSDSLFFMRICQLAVNIFSFARISTSNSTLFKLPIQKASHSALIVDLFGGLDPFAYFVSGKHTAKGSSSIESLKQGAFLISGASALVAFICELALHALKSVGQTWISVGLLAVKIASGAAILGFICSAYQAIEQIGKSQSSAARAEHSLQLASNVSGIALCVLGVIGFSNLVPFLVLGTVCSGFGILNQLVAVRNKEQKIT